MVSTEVEYVNKLDLEEPVMIEGLPGVGHIGKLAIDHLIDELDADKLVEIYSQYLPPQVLVDEEGNVDLAKIEIYGKETEDDVKDILMVSGDHQSVENKGHFEISEKILDVSEEFGVEKIFTLGGFATGEVVETPKVYGAVNDLSLKEILQEVDIKFKKRTPAGGIVGASGLLLGLGKKRGIKAACIMGETSGYMVDPVSSQAVLRTLSKVLGFEISLQELEERAEEVEEIISEIKKKTQQQQQKPQPSRDDLMYIG